MAEIHITPPAEYAGIDTSAAIAALKELHGPSPDATAAAVLATPEKAIPPVLYAAAAVTFASGRREEGAFWLYAAQLRTRFDIERCNDPTVGGAATILIDRYGEPINKWTFQDENRLVTIVERVVAWDRDHPHDYDQRWINLHGMGAFGAMPGSPLSRPESEWATIAERVRREYLDGLREAIEMMRRHREESG